MWNTKIIKDLSFKELIDIYIPEIARTEDPHYVPSPKDKYCYRDLPSQAVCYYSYNRDRDSQERELAEKVLKCYAECGEDLYRPQFCFSGESCLSVLKYLGEEKLLSELVNSLLNEPTYPSTESAAFEDDVEINTSDQDEEGGKKKGFFARALNSIKEGAKTLGKSAAGFAKGLGAAAKVGGRIIGQAVTGTAKNLMNVGNKISEDREAIQRYIKGDYPSEDIDTSEVPTLERKSSSALSTEYKKLKTQTERQLLLTKNLPNTIDGSTGKSTDPNVVTSKSILSKALSNMDDPFSSSLYYTITHPANKISPEVAKLLVDEKFKLPDTLKKFGRNGLKLGTEEGLKQLKFIAYFNFKNVNPKGLMAEGGGWKSSKEMTEYIKSLDPDKLSQGNLENVDNPTVGEDILKKALGVDNLSVDSVRGYVSDLLGGQQGIYAQMGPQLVGEGYFDETLENLLGKKYVSKMGRNGIDLLNGAIIGEAQKVIDKTINSQGKK